MDRPYLGSHPWISFHATAANNLGPKFWILVGEARSKCEHLAGTPLRPDVAAELLQVTLIKGARATTAIEGNTLTEQQVGGILKGTYKAPESRRYQEQEVRNMLDTLTALDKAVMDRRHIALSEQLLCDYNRDVLKGLELEPGVVAGEVRQRSVAVANYRGAPAEDCSYLLGRLAEWLEGPTFKSEYPEMQFALVLLQAVLAHLYMAWIHAFGDGNGRTARLIEFLVLARSGSVPLPAAHLLSNHYNLTRDRYYRELDKASRNGGDVRSFVEYAVQGFVDGIRDEIQRVRCQQFQVSWVNFVHETMARVTSGKTCDRQRALVLAMPMDATVRRADLPGLSPKVAAMYALTGERTLARDLNRLLELRLIRRARGGFIANSRQMAAFLPPMADPDSLNNDLAAWMVEST